MLAFSMGYEGSVTMCQVHPAHSSRMAGLHPIKMFVDADGDDNGAGPKVLTLRKGRTTETILMLHMHTHTHTHTHTIKLKIQITLRT
jgi:hypothetical protein